ncbi:hypothetical protein D3C81_1882560 [compost metagenome]
MVLLDFTGMRAPQGDIWMVPWTRMTNGSAEAAYASSSAWVVAVTVAPPKPPVVPFWPRALTLAQPTGLKSLTITEYISPPAVGLPRETEVFAPTSFLYTRKVLPALFVMLSSVSYQSDSQEGTALLLSAAT